MCYLVSEDNKEAVDIKNGDMVMEIVWIIGILAAFVLGAHIRQPFAAAKRADYPPPPAAPDEKDGAGQKKREEERIRQLNNILNYTGKEQNGED
jgi:hypothetical protein